MSNAIKAIRQAAGLTQADLAELCGTDQSTIQRLENGKISLDEKWASLIASKTGSTSAAVFGFEPYTLECHVNSVKMAASSALSYLKEGGFDLNTTESDIIGGFVAFVYEHFYKDTNTKDLRDSALQPEIKASLSLIKRIV